MTLRYSPCDDTPKAATVALNDRWSTATNLQEYFFFFPYSPLRYMYGSSYTPPFVTAAVTVAVSFLGLFVLNFRKTVFAVLG